MLPVPLDVVDRALCRLALGLASAKELAAVAEKCLRVDPDRAYWADVCAVDSDRIIDVEPLFLEAVAHDGKPLPSVAEAKDAIERDLSWRVTNGEVEALEGTRELADYWNWGTDGQVVAEHLLYEFGRASTRARAPIVEAMVGFHRRRAQGEDPEWPQFRVPDPTIGELCRKVVGWFRGER